MAPIVIHGRHIDPIRIHKRPAGHHSVRDAAPTSPYLLTSSEADHATPEGARADAATPTHTGDTMHMHSVASTAKRQRGRQLNPSARKRAAKRARDADDS